MYEQIMRSYFYAGILTIYGTSFLTGGIGFFIGAVFFRRNTISNPKKEHIINAEGNDWKIKAKRVCGGTLNPFYMIFPI